MFIPAKVSRLLPFFHSCFFRHCATTRLGVEDCRRVKGLPSGESGAGVTASQPVIDARL